MTTTTGKKQSIRLFLAGIDYSRFLVQAGTHHITPTALGERLIRDGLSRLEHGDTTPLDAPAPHEPASHGSGAV